MTNSGKRALIIVALVVTTTGITLGAGYAMGLFGARETQEAFHAAEGLHGGDTGNADVLDAPVTRSVEGEGTLDASVAGFAGTWKCSDYDFDGKVYTFQATFTDTGTFAVWLYNIDEGDDAYYAALRTFDGADGVATEAGGFSFAPTEDGNVVELAVSSANRPHQEKEVYQFKRSGTDPETLKQMSWAIGDWYAHDGSGEQLYLDTNGYWYSGDVASSSNRWFVYNGDIVLENYVSYDNGNTRDLVLTFMGSDFDVLVDMETERIFAWDPEEAAGA